MPASVAQAFPAARGFPSSHRSIRPPPPAAGRAPPPTSRLVAVRLRPQTLLPLPATLLPARAMATNGSSPVRGPARLTLLFIPCEVVWWCFGSYFVLGAGDFAEGSGHGEQPGEGEAPAVVGVREVPASGAPAQAI